MTTNPKRPTAAIARLSGTVGAAKGIVGLPKDERAFLDDLGSLLEYVAGLEKALAAQTLTETPANDGPAFGSLPFPNVEPKD